MATWISSISAQLGRLTTASPYSRTSLRFYANKKRPNAGQEPGHGETIYVFTHFLDGLTVYSLQPTILANRALHQTPYKGKKTMPAKIRKDYWRTTAVIKFAKGLGDVGRSVYQRLRECKTLHEYSWPDSVLYGVTRKTLTKLERGRRLNDQRANSVADMAAVLGGLGKGNKIVVPTDEEIAKMKEPPKMPPVPDEEKVKTKDGVTLVRAKVMWGDMQKKNFAKEWPSNVEHKRLEDWMLSLEVAKIGRAEEDEGVEDEIIRLASALPEKEPKTKGPKTKVPKKLQLRKIA